MSDEDLKPKHEFKRRRAPRYAFGGVAEIADTASGKYCVSLTSEIGRFGCFVKASPPFSPGETVSLKITHNEWLFSAIGRVAYVVAGKGMGIAFDTVSPNQQAVLERWLAQFTGGTIRTGNGNGDSAYFAKREVPRYAIVAGVEVTEKDKGVRACGQVTEISRKGCLIKIANIIPLGTPVGLEIAIQPGTFASDGAVIYTTVPTGIGVAFRKVSPNQMMILENWLGANASSCVFFPGRS